MEFRFYYVLNVTIAHKIHLQQLNVNMQNSERNHIAGPQEKLQEISIFHDYLHRRKFHLKRTEKSDRTC